MSGKLYALMVGINEYQAPVPKLRGCVNDVNNFRWFINERYGHLEPEIEVLTDEDATRDNIIRLFREHLCLAGENDIVLFQYSGHGSREIPAKELRDFFSENKAETLVCYDSRLEGGYDLADKELAILISEVAKKNPHIIVILDCCHAGSGTREIGDEIEPITRQSNDRTEPRNLSTYLDGWYENQFKTLHKFEIPTSKHILLAACDRIETAKETRDGSGVFSSTFMKVLKRNNNINYADLFQQCRLQIVNLSMNQTPQFDAIEGFDPFTKFLEGTPLGESLKNQVYFQNGNWFVNIGANYGLNNYEELNFRFAIYNSDEKDFTDKNILGYANATYVLPEKSKIQPDNFQPDTQKTYTGVLVSMLQTQLTFFVSGNENLYNLFSSFKPNLLPVEFQKENEKLSKYALEFSENEILIYQTNNILSVNSVDNKTSKILICGVKLASNQINKDDENLKNASLYIFDQIKKILLWERTLNLDNKKTAFINDDIETEFYIIDNGVEIKQKINEFGEFELKLPRENGKSIPVQCRIKVKNVIDSKVNVALYYLSRKYMIHAFRNEPFEAKSISVAMLDNKFSLPEGFTETLEILKFIISTDKIDDFLITQKAINLGEIVDFSTSQNVSTRDIDIEEPTKRKIENDWFTKIMKIRVI